MKQTYIETLARSIQRLRLKPNRTLELQGRIDALVATLCRQILNNENQKA